MNAKAARALLALGVILIIGACTPDGPEVPRDGARPARPASAFGPEDRRIAQALSIGNLRALDEASDPYTRAILCRLAMDEVGPKMRALNTLSAGQLAAMDRLKEDFARTAAMLARTQGKSDAQYSADLRRIAQEHEDPGERGQIAVGCIRRLL